MSTAKLKGQYDVHIAGPIVFHCNENRKGELTEMDIGGGLARSCASATLSCRVRLVQQTSFGAVKDN
jgi:hypothetical protein